MKEVVDLYAKLLIGAFSFIGPSFTLLIPIFYNAIREAQIRHKEVLANLLSIASQQIQDDVLDEGFKHSNEIQKLVNKNKKELNLLNPRRQVKRLFFSLIPAICLVIFYYFQHSTFWPYKFQYIRVLTIISSLFCFIYCLRVLWQIFCIIILIKQQESKSQALTKTKQILNAKIK